MGYEIPFDDLLGFEGVLVKLPAWWFTALLGWGAMLGLILFLFGRRLIRPAWACAGMILAGALCILAANTLALPGTPFIYGIVGAVVGAVLAGLILWRLLLAITAAAVAFALGCAAVVWAFDLPGPPVVEPIRQTVADLQALVATPGIGPTSQVNDEPAEPIDDLPPVRIADPDAVGPEFEADTEPAITEAEEPAPTEPQTIAADSASEAIARGWDRLTSGWVQWWTGQSVEGEEVETPDPADPPTTIAGLEVHDRQKIVGFGVGAAILVFLLALASPSIISAPVTAAVGGLLMLALAYHLTAGYAPSMYAMLPPIGGWFFVLLTAVTVIGAALQWTLLRPKTDKRR